MVAHPNRTKRANYARNPTPEEITKAREKAGLTKVEAAELVFATYRGWHNYEIPKESPDHRRMHPAIFALFLLLTDQLTIAELKRAARDKTDQQ